MEVGKTYLVQSVTNYLYLGRVKEIHPFAVTLAKCSWVADAGRLGALMRGGMPAESEFLGEWTVNYAGYGPWPFALPKEDR